MTTQDKKPALKKKIELKPLIRMRVRCRNDHKDPWLRRLYVLWAVPPEPGEEGAAPPDPVFHVAQSDAAGYLSPVKSELDPVPDTTIPMFPDHKYLFYFVRHPSVALAEQVLGGLKAGYKRAEAEWGKPHELAPKFQNAGKSKKGEPIMEGIIEVDEDPKAFIQLGGSFYEGWALFRDMPGTGSNRTDQDIQCEPLKTQVRRLQHHLGALRYPIGNQWHPYSPEPWTPTKQRPRGTPEQLYPNDSVFDIVTWNCVLMFQRDASRGEAMLLDPQKSRTRLLSQGSFDPLPAADDWMLQIRESTAYLSTVTADKSEAFADIPKDCLTLVESRTALAIQKWLAKGFRKPGKILIARGQYDSWMQEDASDTVETIDRELKSLGFVPGLRFNSTFRDTRMSVLTPMPGQIVTSIHKSGFAFDLAMASDYANPHKDCPYYFVRDESVKDRVKWTVYAKVEKRQIPPGLRNGYVEFAPAIEPWKYDSSSPEGGKKGPLLQSAEHVFLNLTKLNHHFGLISIPAHKSGWQAAPPKTYTITDTASLQEFVKRLAEVVANSQWAPDAEAVFNGHERHKLPGLKGLLQFLQVWLKVAARHGATPDVEVDPTTKEGEALLRALRAKEFKDRKVEIVTYEPWDGGEGATIIAKEERFTIADLVLGPKTDFPADMLFMLRPLTEPVRIMLNTTIELPGLGHAAHMEWWHFQFDEAYEGKKWGEILELIGWSHEGLLGKRGKDDKGIFGLWGLGYLPKHLDAKVG